MFHRLFALGLMLLTPLTLPNGALAGEPHPANQSAWWTDRLPDWIDEALAATNDGRERWTVMSRAISGLAALDDEARMKAVAQAGVENGVLEEGETHLLRLAAARSTRGDIAGAQAAADAMNNAQWRDMAYWSIVGLQALAGELDRATGLLEQIADPHQRDGARVWIVPELVRAERVGEARRMLEAIASPDHSARAELFLRRAEAGELMPRAESPFLDHAVRRSGLFGERMPAGTAVAHAWRAARRGPAEQFDAHADMVLEQLEEVSSPADRAVTLGTLAVAAFEQGYEDKALGFASLAAQDMEQEDRVTSGRFGSAAVAYIHTRLEPWHEVREQLVDDEGRVIFVPGIAAALTEAARFDELAQWVEDMESAGDRVEAFAEFARALATSQ